MDKFWERYIQSRPAPGESKGAFDAFAAAHKEPRSVDSEPRSNYADGLKVDPVADSGKKISQVLGAYKRYRRGEKNPVINFSKFFEMWARENFADGQLVRNTVDGSRPGYSGSAFTRALMLLKNFNKTGAVKGLEEKLIKKYKSEGMEFIEALKKAQTEAGGVRYEGRMKIIKEAMDNTNIHSDDYVDLLDMKIKIEDPNFAKQYVNFSENLKNKTRSRHDSNWAEANFGEEYGTKLDQARVREINKSIDPNITERSLVDDIDDMNTANIDEFFGRKKNADGGVQQLVSNTVDGSRPGYNGNLDRRLASAQELYDLYGKDTVDNAAKEWAKKSNLEKNRTRQMEITNFDEMPNANDRNTFKVKFLKDIEKYGKWNPDRKSSAATKRYANDVKRARTGVFEQIIYDAFGRKDIKGTNKPNPNLNLYKLDAIRKNLDEYKILKKYLYDNFKITVNLDHGLDKKTIQTIMNSSAADLTSVNILEQNLNNGFKKQLNNKYFEAVQMGGKAGLKKKRAVEELAKKFNLDIGSIPDNQFVKDQVGPFEFNKIKKGAPSFETLNIKDAMLNSLKNADKLNTKWGQYIKENPGIFEDAGFDLKTLKKPKNVENIATNIDAIIKELGGKEKMSKLLATGTGSIEERNLIRQVIKTGFDFAKGTGKAAVNLLNPKEFLKLKSWVGKPAMAFMAAVEVLDVADRWVRQGIPIKEALGEKWTKFLMPRTLKEYQTEGMREANALSSPASKRYAKNIDLSNDLIRTYDKLEMLEKGEAAKITGTSDVERIANLKKSITAKEKKYSEFINQKDKDGNVLGDGELDFKKDYNEYRALTKKGRDFKAFTTTGRDFTDLNIPFTEIGGMNDMGTDKMSGLKIDRTYTPMYKIGTSKIPSEHELALDATLSARPHVRERLIAPTTSKNFKYQDQKLPDEIRQKYEKHATEKGIPGYGILPPRTSLSQVPDPDGGNLLDAITKFYNVGQKRKQASMYPDFHGSQFAEGGIANTRVGFRTGSSIASILSKFFKPKPKKTITIKRGESGTIGASGNSEKDFFNRYYFPPKGGFTNQSADARYFSKLGGTEGKPKVLTAEITPAELREGYRLRSLDSKDPEIGDIIIPKSAKDKVKIDYYNTIRARIEKILKNND